jgi:hypothetical protein
VDKQIRNRISAIRLAGDRRSILNNCRQQVLHQ